MVMMPWTSSADGTAGRGVVGRALQPQLLFSVGKQAVPAYLLGCKGSMLARKVIPKSVLCERSLSIKHAAFEGPAGRDTICLNI